MQQETRADAKRRRFLEGMHKANHETQSLTIASATTHLERDKMLYYKAIQEASQTPMDFFASLRTTRPMPDGTRDEELRTWRRQFSSSVSAEEVLSTPPEINIRHQCNLFTNNSSHT